MKLTSEMDSRIGLDYIVENHEYVGKLGAALDNNNVTVKKQVFELLSALCAYSAEGYKRAVNTLEYFKTLKDERYKVKIVVDELNKTTAVDYQISLLAFINCIIISAPCLQDRIRIRNEFIGLNLLQVLNNLRREAITVPDLGVQLDVFDEQRECDEEQSLQGSDGINLSSHLDVFYAIFRQVADTPQEIPFLSILQHLLRIDPKEAISDIIWDTTETLVHRATLLENRDDSTRLLRSPSVQKFSCPNCRGGGDITSPNRKQSIPPITANIPLPPAPPPPPPPMAGGNLPPAPPVPPIPPAPPNCNHLTTKIDNAFNRPITPEPVIVESVSRLPQQETPVPKSKMKTINWNKIPPNKVVGKHNIWSLVADSHQNSPMADLDWAEMEGLFCQQQTQNGQGSPKLGRDSGNENTERKSRKENSEITLLDGKRSLNVNIFLKQFRSSNDDIIQLIKEGEHDDIGAEKLRGLLKILPEVDELDMLKSFDGDKGRLGNAEKFLLQLVQVPNYKLRIESMLLKEEFAANLSYLDPSINAIIFAGDDLMTNKLLQEVLYMVVVAGNFLNSGGYAGNAAGVKLSSLQKLTDIRANKPGMNLIHYVAMQADKRNKHLLTFSTQLSTLENASKISVEHLNNEINALETRIKKIRKQVEFISTDDDIKLQMTEFIQSAERDVTMLQRGMKEIESLRLQLAEFFCEDPSSFRIEECFKVFQSFCEKFRQAVAENDRRRVQEEQATLRRKQREEQLAVKRRQLSQAGRPVSDSENSYLLDSIQYDIKSSPAMSRRRIGSFNSNADQSSRREDGPSPDITPNGSLRRRRSRVLSEEDEGNLMDFLRSAGHDSGNRERKSASYGSLDRSWARRARTGSSNKKRPDLLNVDFGVDRERPNSPSPLAETKPLPSEENKPRISREWRQKIESWLQANEQDDKQNEDYRRRARRPNNNRRSLENDSESDRKLDPLPEEKTTGQSVTSPEPYKRVYADWKPSLTLEKTDIVGTIEAIEDAQQLPTKDKSAWRKSNLNVSNSTEDTDTDIRRLRSQRSRDSSTSSCLQSIVEEDKRKSVIQSLGDRSASDRLQIYIRRPSDETTPVKSPPIISAINEEKKPNMPRRIRRGNSTEDTKNNNKIEIDSDNIETPPMIRKNFSNENKTILSPCRKLQMPRPLHKDTIIDNKQLHEREQQKKSSNNIVEEVLGDGQFDRHSLARRTRRYKRPLDYSSGAEERSVTPEITEPDCSIEISSEDKETRLKRWQDKLKTMDSTNNQQNKKIVTRIEKIGRHLSSINQEDVREAIKSLKSPTETPERVWDPIPREKAKEIAPSVLKTSNHELNDEGFEETQSLVSDTPSHGKDSVSSCNDITDCRVKTDNPIVRMTSSDSATGSDSPRRKSLQNTTKIQNFLNLTQTGLDRTRSIKSPASNLMRTVIPRRTNSLRKTDSQNSVERSSSRGSLRSSRSSLNSTVSTNTVKKMPIKKPSVTEMSPTKKPLIMQNSPVKSTTRVPASRSSSSGSSIGPTVRKPPIRTATTVNTSFKENQNIPKISTPRINSTQKKANSVNTSPSRTQTDRRINASPIPRTSGFMRPTTASATKVAGSREK